MFKNILNKFTHDIGIDLGTATTIVSVRGIGIVIQEPSVVAMHAGTGAVLAVGAEARRMIGRTPASIVAVKPLKDGVISDFEATEAMLRYFIHKVYELYPKLLRLRKPRVVIGIPSSITEVEARAVTDAAASAGARKSYIIEEPMAAAIGARLPIEDASGSMIVDIGGGTTDIAVISLGGIVIDGTIRVAGNEIDECILNYMKNKYNLLIGLRTAEDVKIAMGSAIPSEKESFIDIRGRDIITGLPKTIEISGSEVREAIMPVLLEISEAIKSCLERTPPEILSDILERGIVLAGGGALIYGLDIFLENRLKTPVVAAEEPLMCVVKGTEILIDEISLLERVQSTKNDLL